MIITMLFCKDHIDGDDNNSDGGVNDDGDGDYNVDVVDKVKPQLAPLHRREPQLLRLPSPGSCLPPSTVPAWGLCSLFCVCEFLHFFNSSSSHIHILDVHAGILC